MFDAVAGHIVKRIRSRHVQSVTKPAQLAQLLSAYNRLRHSSVVVPELLAAASSQIKAGIADAHEEWALQEAAYQRTAPSPASQDSPADEGSAGGASSDDSQASTSSSGPSEAVGFKRRQRTAFSPAVVASLLGSYCGLSYHPGPLFLSCVLQKLTIELLVCSPCITIEYLSSSCSSAPTVRS